MGVGQHRLWSLASVYIPRSSMFNNCARYAFGEISDRIQGHRVVDIFLTIDLEFQALQEKKSSLSELL